jgi:hypothetical protein
VLFFLSDISTDRVDVILNVLAIFIWVKMSLLVHDLVFCCSVVLVSLSCWVFTHLLLLEYDR